MRYTALKRGNDPVRPEKEPQPGSGIKARNLISALLTSENR